MNYLPGEDNMIAHAQLLPAPVSSIAGHKPPRREDMNVLRALRRALAERGLTVGPREYRRRDPRATPRRFRSR